MEKLDIIDWEKFRANTNAQISHEEYKMVAMLHAKYYKHQYYLPCKCSPKIINTWIAQLNDTYEQHQQNK